MRPLRYSINITLDGCCRHEAELAPDEEPKRFSGSSRSQARACGWAE